MAYNKLVNKPVKHGMDMMRKTRQAVGLIAVVLVIGAAGCTTEAPELPTLHSPTPSLTTLEASAKSYYDCMTDAGIAMEMFPNYQGELAVVQVAESAYTEFAMMRFASGQCSGAQVSDLPSAAEQQINDFCSVPQTGLMIDGIDDSQTYSQCLAQSGYDWNAAQGRYMFSAADMQSQVDANNRWAACVRDNGFPTVQDSVMPTVLDGSQWPVIRLPSTITEDQLRQLLASCPDFDASTQEAAEQWRSVHGGVSTGGNDQPNVTIDTAAESTLSPEDQAHLDALMQVLNEAAIAYFDQQQEGH